MNSESQFLKMADAYCKKHPSEGFTFLLDSGEKRVGREKDTARIVIRDSRATLRKIFSGGSMPLGDLYVSGKWDGTMEDVTKFLEMMINLADDRELWGKLNLFEKFMNFMAVSKSSTKSRGASHTSNINSHYSLDMILDDADASNRFFMPILTEQFPVYTCALWETGAKTLEEAQLAKYKLYAEKLNLTPGKTMIDLGCGWGAQSLWYAKNLGVHVTFVNLSRAQAKHIRGQIEKEGLTDKAVMLEMDAMNIDKLNKKFDAIMSVGLMEHIDDPDLFLSRSSKILAPGGKAIFHTMFNHVHHDFDSWQEKNIWPGVQIPSREKLLTNITHHFHNVSFSPYRSGSYAKTFREWAKNFDRSRSILEETLKQANFKGDVMKFMRGFEYYLLGCSAVYNVYMDVGYALCDNETVLRQVSANGYR